MKHLENLGGILYKEIRASLKRGYLNAFNEIKNLKPEANLILDVGCGKGELLKLLPNNYLFNCGIDLSVKDIKIAHLMNTTTILGDATRLPLREEIFDIVVSSQFFEHVWNVNQALNEQINILKKHGKLIIEQVNLFSIFALINLTLIVAIRTKGKRGGFKWLFNRHKITKSLYENYPGRDEDVKTILWWRDIIRTKSKLNLIDIYSPLSKKLKVKNNIYLKILTSFFSRGIIIIASKI